MSDDTRDGAHAPDRDTVRAEAVADLLRADVVAELIAKIERTRENYAALAADCWERHDVMAAVRFRGLAEGLKVAIGHLDEAVNGVHGVGGLPAAVIPLMQVPSRFDVADLTAGDGHA